MCEYKTDGFADFHWFPLIFPNIFRTKTELPLQSIVLMYSSIIQPLSQQLRRFTHFLFDFLFDFFRKRVTA